MLRRKWNKNLTSENSLFAINLPEGETHMDPDGKKSWLYGGVQGRRYRVEVPCSVKRYCAELLKSLKDQMILPGTQLKAGTWTQESLCRANALGLGNGLSPSFLSELLQLCMKLLIVATEKDYHGDNKLFEGKLFI